MELELNRNVLSDMSSIGYLYYKGSFQMYTLEDKDRGLTQDMSLAQIAKIKIKNVTAIPKGRYRVIISYSNKFKKYLPELLHVPGFDGIRMHPGNAPKDTEGCILVGLDKGKDFIGNSRRAFYKLYSDLRDVDLTEENWVTIK